MAQRRLANGLAVFLAELGDEALWHAARIAQGGLDLTVILVAGLLIYMTGIHQASAELHGRPLFGVAAQADGAAGAVLTAGHAPSSCGLNNDLLASAHRSCIVAMVLEPVSG